MFHIMPSHTYPLNPLYNPHCVNSIIPLFRGKPAVIRFNLLDHWFFPNLIPIEHYSNETSLHILLILDLINELDHHEVIAFDEIIIQVHESSILVLV